MKGISRNTVSAVPTPRILTGNHILLEYQMEGNEQRWVAVGSTRAGRILNIVFAVRHEAIRPITGWIADKATVALYLEQWGLE
jgi:uncharacterized DUF497 family protein